jgi:hypothetical protein
VQKAQNEVQTMKGILTTTINFVTQNAQRLLTTPAPSSSGSSIFMGRSINITGYYTHGQGAIFIIPASSWRPTNISSMSSSLPASALPSSWEDMQIKLKDVQDKARQDGENRDAERLKSAGISDRIKSYLIEAIANYGNGLTTVKPNEYVTLILTTQETSMPDYISGNPTQRCDIISAQKSWITDYKAGRMNMDGFKEMILQYSE